MRVSPFSITLGAALAALTPGACLPTYTVVGGGGAGGGGASVDAGDAGDASDAADDACQGFDCDPKNCGGTNHDCLGGACVGGVCQPVVLATGLPPVAALALSADTVYFAAGNDISSCLKAGCPGGPVGLVSEGSPVSALATDATHLYWAVNDPAKGLVRRCALPQCASDGGVVDDLAISLASPTDVSLDPASFYVTYGVAGAGYVMGCKLTGCGPLNNLKTLYATAQAGLPQRVRATATDLFWTGDDGNVWRCPLAGCNNQPTLFASPASKALMLGPQGIYFSSHTGPGAIFTCGYAATCLNPATLVPTTWPAGDIVVDALQLYWSEYDPTNQYVGTIQRVALSGNTSSPVASGQNAPTRMAIDDTAIYWIDYAPGLGNPHAGSVMRLAK